MKRPPPSSCEACGAPEGKVVEVRMRHGTIERYAVCAACLQTWAEAVFAVVPHIAGADFMEIARVHGRAPKPPAKRRRAGRRKQ